jgi:hypothetical protein
MIYAECRPVKDAATAPLPMLTCEVIALPVIVGVPPLFCQSQQGRLATSTLSRDELNYRASEPAAGGAGRRGRDSAHPASLPLTARGSLPSLFLRHWFDSMRTASPHLKAFPDLHLRQSVRASQRRMGTNIVRYAPRPTPSPDRD